MRFASHRDIARAVERAVRRAGLPVAHSAGFSPHPKISYSGGAPTGAASEAEYLEISLTAALEPGLVRDQLDAALPDGIDVIEVADLAAAPAPRLEASEWQVVLPGIAPDDAVRAVEAFLAAAHAEVDRLTSNGVRRLDTRAGVVSLELDQRAAADGQPGCAILRMVVRHMTPAVRPEDILVAFRRMSALEPASPPVVTRLAQGPLGVDAAAAEASGLVPVIWLFGRMNRDRHRRPGRGRDPAGAARSGSVPARRPGRCTGTGNGNVPGSGDRQHGEYRSR